MGLDKEFDLRDKVREAKARLERKYEQSRSDENIYAKQASEGRGMNPVGSEQTKDVETYGHPDHNFPTFELDKKIESLKEEYRMTKARLANIGERICGLELVKNTVPEKSLAALAVLRSEGLI